MQNRDLATSSTRRRPVAALMAAMLAFMLAFTAFEPGSLRSAFADEGTAAAADATDQGTGGKQATEPAEEQEMQLEEGDGTGDGGGADEGTLGEGQEKPEASDPQEVAPAPEDESAQSAQPDANGARAGPDGEDDPLQGSGTDAGPEDEALETAAEEKEGRDADAQKAARVTYASCTVTFYSDVYDANPSIIARKLVSAEVGKTATVSVADVEASPPTSAQVFDGWSYGGTTARDSIVIDPQDGNVRLYPVFSSGHWLRFTEGEPSSGAVYVASQFIGANDAAPGVLPTTTRQGYSFDGWFTGSMSGGSISYDARMTDSSGNVTDVDELKRMLSSSDVQLYASWVGVQSSYRVICWHENPDDTQYSFESATTIGDDPGERAVSGEMTDVSQLPQTAGFKLAEVKQQVIAGDGSTVVNAYYNREYYSIKFHNGPSLEDDVFDELTITDKFGADIRDRWPKPTQGAPYTSSWYTVADGKDDTYVNGIVTMPLNGADFFLKNDTKMNFNTVFLVQNVDGSDEFTTYMNQPFSASFAPGTTADDYIALKGFMVNAASASDAEEIRANPTGDPNATYDPKFPTSTALRVRYDSLPIITAPDDKARYTSHFRYLRCQYDVVFEENGGPHVPDVPDVYYEASLEDAEPEGYVAGKTTYTKPNGETLMFMGWYSNSALVDDAFDFSSQTMPPNNLVLYAKWEPARYLVQVDPAGGEFTNDAQSTFFWVDHGDSFAYIDAQRDYVEDDDGTHVYNYEAGPTDGDEFGSAQYVLAEPGDEGQRYSYSDDAYTLFGWYRTDDAARAEVPYDFGSAVTEDISLVARWKAAGMFDIWYNPVAEIGGATVSGDIETRFDDGYADLSPTFIVNTPENIESSDGDEYVFAGWQLVEHFDEGAQVLEEELYQEGDGFIVNSDMATNNTIHMQAVYEEVPEQPSDPSDPVTPDDPATPEDPVTPDDPATPEDPADPSDPGDGSTAPDTLVPEGGTTPETDDDADDATTTTTTTTTQTTTDSQDSPSAKSYLPQTGDQAKMLASTMGGVALISLAVALIARAMRRSFEKDE